VGAAGAGLKGAEVDVRRAAGSAALVSGMGAACASLPKMAFLILSKMLIGVSLLCSLGKETPSGVDVFRGKKPQATRVCGFEIRQRPRSFRPF
jgi:phosphoribosylcarboxyaminoimidazole (NCAIR) mutase